MAGRAQRIIWFLLLSPCCLPTFHFLICLKIILFVSLLLLPPPSLFLQNYSICHLVRIGDKIQKPQTQNTSIKHLLQKTLFAAFRSGGCCKNVATTRNCLWQTAQPKPSRPLPCQPYGMLAHLATVPRWWTIRSPPTPHSGGLVLYGLVNGVWRKSTHIRKKKFNNHAPQCMFISVI